MTERDRAKSAARRLAIIRYAQEVSGNVALTCRYHGITRQNYYVWLWRYESLAELSLRFAQDRDVPEALPRAGDPA